MEHTEKKTIHCQLTEIGAELDYHESDLYVKDEPKIWPILGGYEFVGNITRFRSPIDDAIWLDIPFANDYYWMAKESAKCTSK